MLFGDRTVYFNGVEIPRYDVIPLLEQIDEADTEAVAEVEMTPTRVYVSLPGWIFTNHDLHREN